MFRGLWRALIAALSVLSCRHQVHGQRVPRRALDAVPGAFQAAPGEAVLHYYGAGGWGLWWRGRAILFAPYFSNHDAISVSPLNSHAPLEPDLRAVERGLRGTPVSATDLVLVGHGHVDHAADLPALFGDGPHRVPPGRAALAADRSTVHLLDAALGRFGACRVALDRAADGGDASRIDPCVPRDAAGRPIARITPIVSDHAPHLRLGKVRIELFDGAHGAPLGRPAALPADFQIGHATWAFLVDLLDEQGGSRLRVLYMDAAASWPAARLDPPGPPVDVLIACAAGYRELAAVRADDRYPEELVRHYRVRYVLAAHWENFFTDPYRRLEPVPPVLTDSHLDAFVDRIEAAIDSAIDPAAAPLAPPAAPVGPHGPRWALPIPGETFRFRGR